MGYDTNYNGSFELDKELSLSDFNELIELNNTRHEKYLNTKYEDDPRETPSLYCPWTPSENGLFIEFDGLEKPSGEIFWIREICKILAAKGYILNGEVEWNGQESGDMGKIKVVNNVVSIKKPRIEWD